MAELPKGIPAIARQIGHKSLSAHVYSHPRAGVAATLNWGIFEGSTSVRSYSQVKLSRDFAIADWKDALDILEQCIAVARRQLELLDVPD